MKYSIRITILFIGIIIGIETFSNIPVIYINEIMEFVVQLLIGGIVWILSEETWDEK